MQDVAKYLGILFGLIALYLIVSQGSQSTSVIKAISSANTNAILALQGRTPTSL